MPIRLGRDVIERWYKNPIITLENVPFPCNTVFNAAATKMGDEYILLLRVEDLAGRSVFALARSDDGYHFSVDPQPVMEPSKEEPFRSYERRGIEDPRITFLEGEYYIMYTASSRYGARLALCKTQDFKTFERLGLISEPENKDGCLLPRKINGRYVRLDRPYGGGIGNIWISYSDDLLHWGDSEVIMTTRGGFWDADRIGAGAPPIETEHGWLVIYHGVKNTSAGPIYRMGAALLDLDNPSKVLCRSAVPILNPREYYERVGDVGNVVFSCGAILEDGGKLKIYYGAADTCICLGFADINHLIDRCWLSPEGEDIE
ncbi:MAG: glycoside hydrolase family 130 protein [Armatimonadetes bacterium]|nr:glycoside hydrolase family 130 protein [Armatimonadota bacterium]